MFGQIYTWVFRRLLTMFTSLGLFCHGGVCGVIWFKYAWATYEIDLYQVDVPKSAVNHQQWPHIIQVQDMTHPIRSLLMLEIH